LTAQKEKLAAVNKALKAQQEEMVSELKNVEKYKKMSKEERTKLFETRDKDLKGKEDEKVATEKKAWIKAKADAKTNFDAAIKDGKAKKIWMGVQKNKLKDFVSTDELWDAELKRINKAFTDTQTRQQV